MSPTYVFIGAPTAAPREVPTRPLHGPYGPYKNTRVFSCLICSMPATVHISHVLKHPVCPVQFSHATTHPFPFPAPLPPPSWASTHGILTHSGFRKCI